MLTCSLDADHAQWAATEDNSQFVRMLDAERFQPHPRALQGGRRTAAKSVNSRIVWAGPQYRGTRSTAAERLWIPCGTPCPRRNEPRERRRVESALSDDCGKEDGARPAWSVLSTRGWSRCSLAKCQLAGHPTSEVILASRKPVPVRRVVRGASVTELIARLCVPTLEAVAVAGDRYEAAHQKPADDGNEHGSSLRERREERTRILHLDRDSRARY
jgi:hypothetical protein